MQDLKHAGLTELLDLLIEHTTRYLQIRIYGGTKEQFYKCQQMMTQLQKEIRLRKATMSPSTVNASTGSSFPRESSQKFRQKNSG